MLWNRLDTGRFDASYSGYLMGLEGAIALSIVSLKARNPRLAIAKGLASASTVTAGSKPNVIGAARMLIAEAVSFGSQDAEGTTDPGLQIRHAENVEMIVSNMMSLDDLGAKTIIRNQALAYDIAYRTMSHDRALKKALGEDSDDHFTQLDRASRRLKSGDMVLGFVRLGVAQAYLDSFASAAAFRGITKANLIREGQEPVVAELADIAELRKLFHPNTPYELRLPA